MGMDLPDDNLIPSLQIYTGISHNATPNYLLMILGGKLNMKFVEFALSFYFLVSFSLLVSAQWPQPLWDPKPLLCRVQRLGQKLWH